MALLVLDPVEEERLKAERESCDGARYDEVWEGVYVMAPLANNEHQDLQLGLAAALKSAVGWDSPARVHAGANVSDREEDWEYNYRIPDVVVVFPGGSARDCGTHWCGGPDFCVEIASRGDRNRQKLDFYASIGVRELLLINREPWEVELFRLTDSRLGSVGRTGVDTGEALASDVVPVSFRLIPGEPRPKIEVIHRDGVQRWLV
jgi:Uma2 family endonuclease